MSEWVNDIHQGDTADSELADEEIGVYAWRAAERRDLTATLLEYQ